ncbi:MAG: hypothetical protein QME58_08365 [Bacteroidota bacterium]|nr:hypothetical protein [Bacteroidota bacterium]
MAGARLSAGNWKIDFNLENNPIPALGHPKDFFTGGRVIVVGTAEESDFKAQMEQKQLIAQQEADKALKAQQAEQERLNAEQQRKRIADEQERQRRQITLDAERKVAEKAAEEDRLRREKELAEFQQKPTYLVGNWSWTVCRGKYTYTMVINSHTPDGTFSGWLSDGAGKISGTLVGNRIRFTRVLTSLGNQQQSYSARLAGARPNLKMVDGTWSGAYEELGEGTDFHCEMVP